MKVYLVQALCPKRHAIAAHVQEAEPADLEDVRDMLRTHIDMAIAGETDGSAVQLPRLNPWCGICGARRETWTFEVGETPYKTLKEAMPAIRSVELENLLSRALIDEKKRKDTLN